MTVLLRQEGAIVRAFDNAEQALAAAENGTFDLIISDLGMPGMNGLEFMQRLKRRPVPVKAIALTAYADEAPRTEALAAGYTRGWLGRSPQRLEALGGLGGLVMIGLGVRLALVGRRD